MNTPMKLSTLVLAGLAVLTVPPRALASPITLPLNPGDMLAQTHSRAMMIATTGTFRSLSGTRWNAMSRPARGPPSRAP